MSWFKTHRGWQKSPVFRNNDERIAWLWMIENAEIEAKTIAINGNPVRIERGQFSHSIRFMAKAIGIKTGKMETILKHFKKWDMIQTEVRTGQNLITICNYSEYQDNPDSTQTANRQDLGQQADSTQTPLRTKIKKEKNLKNKKKDKGSKSKKDYSEDFEAFWKAYPRKEGKKTAKEKYQNAREEVSQEIILAGLVRYKTHKEDWRPWKMPSTWLHGQHWNDQYSNSEIADVEDFPVHLFEEKEEKK